MRFRETYSPRRFWVCSTLNHQAAPFSSALHPGPLAACDQGRSHLRLKRNKSRGEIGWLHGFGHDDAPLGHAEEKFIHVRLPASNFEKTGDLKPRTVGWAPGESTTACWRSAAPSAHERICAAETPRKPPLAPSHPAIPSQVKLRRDHVASMAKEPELTISTRGD